MRGMVLLLVILGLLILNNRQKKHIHEGFTQCDYRKKSITGSMCKEKWGEPPCNKWEPNERMKRMR